MQTEALDNLFLEISQFTNARTRTEMAVIRALKPVADRFSEMAPVISQSDAYEMKTAIEEALFHLQRPTDDF